MLNNMPVIGITCRGDVSGIYKGRPVNAQNTSYIEAVIAAGGLPILIPLQLRSDQLDALFETLDGLLFTGGGDIEPSRYNQHPAVENLGDVQTLRDEVEITLLNQAMREEKPFFAICRGIQVMNVAQGGSLWQDLSEQYAGARRHDYFYGTDVEFPRDYIAHQVEFERESLLGSILGKDEIAVNSLHHQGVKDIAPSLRLVGRAEDGVIEVLEGKDHPFALGVQWHPEELTAKHEDARQLFTAFVNASRRNGNGKG